MREFTKSMMSYTWAMSLFGVQQMVNVFRPSKATESFDNVTEATRDEFGDGMRAAFRAGDNLQRGMVDLTFGLLGLGMFNGRGGASSSSSSCSASDMGRWTGDVIRESVNAAGQAADAAGRVAQGAVSYASDATRQGMGRADMRGGAGRGGSSYDRTYGRTCDSNYDRTCDTDCDRTYDRGGRAASGTGQQATGAFRQGMRAMGDMADAAGRTMEGMADATADAMGGGGGGGGATGRGTSDASSRQAQSASAGQTQSWGRPPRGSGTTRKY